MKTFSKNALLMLSIVNSEVFAGNSEKSSGSFLTPIYMSSTDPDTNVVTVVDNGASPGDTIAKKVAFEFYT